MHLSTCIYTGHLKHVSGLYNYAMNFISTLYVAGLKSPPDKPRTCCFRDVFVIGADQWNLNKNLAILYGNSGTNLKPIFNSIQFNCVIHHARTLFFYWIRHEDGYPLLVKCDFNFSSDIHKTNLRNNPVAVQISWPFDDHLWPHLFADGWFSEIKFS